MSTANERRCFSRSCVVLAALVLGACATQTSNIETGADLREIAQDQSVVFGRIAWFEDGEEKKIGSGVFSMSLTPNLLRIEDKARIMAEVNAGGRFTWSLAPGTYLINKIAYRDPWSGNYFVAPKVAFAVPEVGKTYSVGVLECRFKPERDLIGGLSGLVVCQTLDADDKEVERFRQKYALTAEETIAESAMVFDERLPSTVDTTAEFNLAVSIINAILYGASQ